MNQNQVAYLTAAAVYTLLGAGLLLLVRLIASGRLGRNAFVGLRTPAIMASDDAWNAGHRRAIPEFKLGALILLVGAVVLVVCTVVDAPKGLGVTITLVVVGLTVAILIFATILASAAARKLST